MSKGFLIFAENSKSCNYIEQAYALALSIKNTQSNISKVSLVTNDRVSKTYQKVFDKIIPIPWVSNTSDSPYKAEHRWKLFHITPYEETIVLDADMLFLDDVTDWWDYCSNHDLKFCSRIKNYKREVVLTDPYHRRAFIDNNLTNPYFALHYFKKTDRALDFYKALEFISNNWEWCYTKFAPISYQNWLSMDLASAIAIEITGYYDAVIDKVCPLEFVHMKPMIQKWTAPTESWQDAVPYVLNSKGELTVGNIKQSKLFHYVEKDFMSKKILSRLKEINNGLPV
jgi:hypothetical protein